MKAVPLLGFLFHFAGGVAIIAVYRRWQRTRGLATEGMQLVFLAALGGALAGGYLAVELVKRLLRITRSTGTVSRWLCLAAMAGLGVCAAFRRSGIQAFGLSGGQGFRDCQRELASQ